MTADAITDQVQLPRWVSHKKVWADKITSISASLPLVMTLACGATIKPTPDLCARGMPGIGDYYVQYEDGYESWSPAKAFEDGYARI